MTPSVDPVDDALSVVEDLDPEPEPGGKRIWRSSRMRDLVLGLAILLSVVGWAGYSSWHDASNGSNYAQAQQDASLHHWDEALAHYSSAKGYKDADALAANASKQIEARNSQYQAAKSYSQTGPAIQELLAARSVQTIEPGYKDIDLIASQAEAQVYTDALSGTVAIRTEADPPGLYYRGPNGWAYLRGSDQWSRVLSIPFSAVSANHIVYDVAGPNWKAPGPIIKSPFGPYGYPIAQGSPDKVGRRLVMAELSGESGDPKFVDLQLNPMDYNFYVCGNAGVWGIRYDPGISDTIIAKGILDGFSPTYEATAPQATGRGTDVVAPVATPGTDGVVADFGHGGTAADELLLAAHGTRADNKSGTELYLAGADGSHPRLVFSTGGTLVSAILSPDDRHALVVASEAPANLAGSLAVNAILLTLDGSVPPRTLERISLDDASAAYNIPSPLAGRLSLSGVFLENGAFKNKLLLSWAEGSPATGVRIRLLDIANPDNILTEATVPDEQIGVLPVVESPDGRTLLLYEQDAAPTPVAGKSPTVYLEVLQAEAGTGDVKANSFNVPLPATNTSSDSTPYFMNPAVRGSNLVYSVETFTTMPETTSAYSLPLADLGDQNSDEGRRTDIGAAQPLQLFSHIWPATQSIGDPGPEPVSVSGPGAYAYTDSNGTLHAHLYDAAGDISLEPGVGTIFELNASYFYKVLH